MFSHGRNRLFPSEEWKDELLRWGFLLGVVLWLFHPFLTGRAIGTGDAIWYEHMLADFVLQWRAGIFPVFVGQTEYAFNGAVYPLRVAPLFQHWAGVLDLLTFHRLSFFWLQHLVVVTVAASGIVSCYFCLTALAPSHRWLAALFAVFYVTCPGVVGVVVVQDLYMSWMTLPFLPILMFGLARSFQNDDGLTWAAIAGSLAALWLGHAPIALWACLIAGAVQLYRLCTSSRNRRAWTRAVFGAAVFALLAQYPFVSVATLHTGAASPAGGALEHPERIVESLENAFPGCFLPLSPGASRLSDLQLGYALWGAVALAIAALLVTREKTLLIFLGPIAALILLLIPLPHWTRWFWVDFSPEILRRLTYYWPMHRFYLLLASMASFAGLIGCAAWLRKPPARVKPLTIFLAVGCVWSLWQAREFVEAAKIRTATIEDTARKERPENRLLMNHAYGLFERLPATFSNGVVDPAAQFRLINSAGQLLVRSKEESEITQQGSFRGSLDANPGVINFEPMISLEPGKHYDLTFAFGSREDHGILQLVGPTFFREYVLPSSGEAEAFGQIGANSRTLNLWTSEKKPEPIRIRFIPLADAAINRFAPFADFVLRERNAKSTGRELLSWAPLRVHTELTEAAELETPRVFISGYSAALNGHPVLPTRSPEGLLDLNVPAGATTIELSYEGPWLLRVSYWLEIGAWGAFLAATATACLRKPEATGTSARI